MEIAKNAPLSREIVTFYRSFVQAARRSFVENDRQPLFQGAPDDGWNSARFWELFLNFGSLPFLVLFFPEAGAGRWVLVPKHQSNNEEIYENHRQGNNTFGSSYRIGILQYFCS
jgi:hypothetical protein